MKGGSLGSISKAIETVLMREGEVEAVIRNHLRAEGYVAEMIVGGAKEEKEEALRKRWLGKPDSDS